MYSAGMGIHADKVPLDEIVRMAKLLVAAEIFYAFNLAWTKLSVLLMYYRVFRFPLFKNMAYGIGAFVIAWVITITFLFIFICVPVEKLWYPDLPGHCIDQVGTWIANAASTILSDIAILVLPIPQVWKLQLRKPEKIGVTFAFCLGFLYVTSPSLHHGSPPDQRPLHSVVFASAYRFSVLFSYSNSDPTYTLAPTVGWTAIEMSAGIVSACLPTLGPVFAVCANKLGIKRSLLTTRGERTNNTSSSKTFAGQSGTGSMRDGADLELQKARKASGGAGFYRLPDSEMSGDTARAPDAELRPKHGYGYTVTSQPTKGDGESLSGDEVPLHGIRVHTDFKQSTAE